jgi:hypothetical protein
MLPAQLHEGVFVGYPPEARVVATRHLPLFQKMPAVFVPIMLREVIAYDWRFPIERKELDDQFDYLGSLSGEELGRVLGDFGQIQITPELSKLDWVGSPGVFVEQLTAYLWASRQMDRFRAAADEYAKSWRTARPQAPPVTPRLAVVVVGRGVAQTTYPVFRKLRPHGVYFTKVNPEGGLSTVLEAVVERAAASSEAYSHWYIDGGESATTKGRELTRVSYAALEPVRTALLKRMQRMIQSGSAGPEAVRTMLAQLGPQDVGLPSGDGLGVLNRFQISLLTEGSGTQIFSTTFAQWAAREALRRAQPSTLLVRFAPRQRQQPMNEMLSGSQGAVELDPEGSLIDADMGAYYTWLNGQRLPGAERSKFLAWFEDHNEAVAIGPTLPHGTVSTEATDLSHILSWL